jgi:hypothetical protein
MVIKRLRHAIKMRRSSKDNEDVENLVRRAPNVERLWPAPLRPPQRVNESSRYVQQALSEHPRKPHALIELLVAVYTQAVDNRHYAGGTQAYEHHGAVWSPLWRAEVLEPGDGKTTQAERPYLRNTSITTYITRDAV